MAMDTARIDDSDDLGSPALYLNRETSFLTFNKRVLEQARDDRLPLLERLRFLAICSSNLDEFFEIRVAGLKQRLELDNPQIGPDGMTPQDQLAAISVQARNLIATQYDVLNQSLLPALAQESIRLVGTGKLGRTQTKWAREYFEREVEPVLSPLGLDPGRPFPRIQNKSLNFILRVSGSDAFGRDTTLATRDPDSRRRTT
jgi:polyphosphate kinase